VTKAKERWPEIGRATEYLGGVCERGTSTMDDLATWEIRDLSRPLADEYAQRNVTNGAESGREAEVGGPQYERRRRGTAIAPGPGRAKGSPCTDDFAEGTMSETTISTNVSPKLTKVMELARKDPGLRLRSLAHVLDEQLLMRSFHQLRKDAAVGVDAVAKEEYGRDLEANIRSLHERMKASRYRHQPIRRVHIPKANGKLRPLGISCTEDKIVQGALTTLLTAVYEPVFLNCSYGFRPGRSAHDAITALHGITGEVTWILEADIEAFFDSIDRKKLMDELRKRIDDESLLRLIGKCLHVGVLEGEHYSEPDVGTAQGSSLSPLLGNVYLHYALDEWFARDIVPRLNGTARLIRYADDFVIGFARKEDAERVLRVLPQRLGRYSLRLSPEKTRLVRFGRPTGDDDDDGNGTFDFLGFSWYWGRRENAWTVHVKTRTSRLTRALVAIAEWCRKHRHDPVREQHIGLKRRLQGHYNYFAVRTNERTVWRLLYWATRIWRKTLSRRSQRSSITWPRFMRMERALPLPRPKMKRLWWSPVT
jgi:group II intron reverse transcriptase/maturase